MASVKLEVGKFYRTRDGRKSPMITRIRDDGVAYFNELHDGETCCHPNGRISYSHVKQSAGDLISEWTDAPTNPVRTVTRKELIPGLYGNVYVEEYEGQLGASMEFTADPAVIRAAIATLTEIADALEENQ